MHGVRKAWGHVGMVADVFQVSMRDMSEGMIDV
jgi:hypothetical protein